MSGHLKSEKVCLTPYSFSDMYFSDSSQSWMRRNEYRKRISLFWKFWCILPVFCSLQPGFLICSFYLFVPFCWMCLLLPWTYVQTCVGPRHPQNNLSVTFTAYECIGLKFCLLLDIPPDNFFCVLLFVSGKWQQLFHVPFAAQPWHL